MAKGKKNKNNPVRIIIKFVDTVIIPNDGQEQFIIDKLIPAWNQLANKFPGITLGKLFSTVPYQRINELVLKGKSQDPNYKPANLLNFYWVDGPHGTDTVKLMADLAKINTIEMVYEEGESVPSCVNNAPGNPKYLMQNYLDPSPVGIDAIFAWTKTSRDDKEPLQLIDIEQGWFLNHEDFPAIGSPSEISLLSGVNKQYKGHGTAVLGVILSQDNAIGGVGITPCVKTNVISNWRDSVHRTANDADAILDAIDKLNPGDVLLIELQKQRIVQLNLLVLPVETDPAVFEAISLGSANGITIIESAGNGNIDLDSHKFSIKSREPKAFILRRGNIALTGDPAFRDSGAVMIGSATSGVPHERLVDESSSLSSNYGTRIDCYAWGENITTAGNNGTGGPTLYTSRFGGTSGAAAIVAGAAIAVQSMLWNAEKRHFTSRQLRSILSDPETGTNSNDPLSDKIGVMPDLKLIFEKFIRAGANS
ncbi:MAG TPA: S8 family serine peptidase [Chitinophagaceae bacterium]|nr:S8 family serine peptidase [Chitinophagaceae bacterium]